MCVMAVPSGSSIVHHSLRPWHTMQVRGLSLSTVTYVVRSHRPRRVGSELLASKDEALSYFKVELGRRLKAFRTDCGGEFKSGAFFGLLQ
jgi:hypothetical protein